MGAESKRKVAIVAVHGVGPQQRYVMQDTVAGGLASRLTQHTGHKWEEKVVYPSVNQQKDAAQSYASALRVSQKGVETGTVFDVYEAYWSPIDKGKTNISAVFWWILKTLFVPLSTTARLPARAGKLLFDGTYTAVAMILVAALFVAALFLTVWGYVILAPGNVSDPAALLSLQQAVWTAFTAPLTLFAHFKPLSLIAVGAAFAGIYLVLQFVVALRAWVQHPTQASLKAAFKRGYAWWQFAAGASLLLVAAGLGFAAFRLIGGAPTLTRALFAAAGGAIALRLALSLAQDFFVNRIGDVQIYTTRDWNTELHALRDKITETVQDTIQQVLGSEYERVYILGHSLGSTVAMDALIRLHQLVEADTLEERAWQRIRGLVTFGTALEKTKFFFDVAHPSLSESYDQWRGQVYGHVFSLDPKVLTTPTRLPHKIYWTNYWYFTDLVANEIRTYVDGTVPPEDREAGEDVEICRNVRLASKFPLRLWVHSDYLADMQFWNATAEDDSDVPSLLNILLAEDEPGRAVTGEAEFEEVVVYTDGP